jgi:hypothetical protein
MALLAQVGSSQLSAPRALRVMRAMPQFQLEKGDVLVLDEACWDDDGLYVIGGMGPDYFVDEITVRTGRGTLRKWPEGVICPRYEVDDPKGFCIPFPVRSVLRVHAGRWKG